MPIYEYCCESCSTEFEALRPMPANNFEPCPQCGNQAERVPSRLSVNFNKNSSRSAERHSKLPADQQARVEQDRFVQHSKKTGIPYGDLFETHE
jgi:putative FmdB family regulatory protein